MNYVLASLRLSLNAVLRSFREPRLYVALLLGLLLWIMAYQDKRDYVIDIADMAYHPYISNFNDIETAPTDPPLVYRWSKANPRITILGVGNQPVQLSITTIGSRPSLPPPAITLKVRDQIFTLQTHPEVYTDTFLVERGNLWDGNFVLDISVPTFTPQGDARELGVIIRQVVVRPAHYGLRPVVVPPLGTVLSLLLGVAATYLFALVTTRRRSIALILLYGSIVFAAVGILTARPDVGFLAGELPALWAWGLLFALLGRALLDAILRDAGRWAAFVAAGSAAFALSFMVRFGGLTYAQFLTSDLMLHIHNIQDVMRGNWVFTEPLPDGTPVPYPPAYYLLTTVLSWLVGNSEEMLGLLLKWSASLLDAVTCLALAWAGWRVMPGRWGGLAALTYACSPAAFDLFSAGNYTNLFGQSLLNLTLLGGLVFLQRWNSRQGWSAPVLLAGGFGLTMLGHYSMIIATLAIVGFFTIWIFISLWKKKPVGNAPLLLGAWVAALVGSFALYYWHFLGEIWSQWTGVLGRLAGSASTERSEGRPGFLQALGKLPEKLNVLMGGMIVLTGAFGWLWLGRVGSQVRALLGAWLAATVVFALLDQALGDSVRWYYLGAAPLALLAARFLGGMFGRGGWARRLTWLVLFAMGGAMIGFWVNLIYTRYH